MSRRQLLAAGAGAAGAAAGAGLISAHGLTPARAAALPGSAKDVAAASNVKISMSVVGQKQGQLKGDPGKSKVMAVYAVSVDLSVPFDPSTGLITGHRQHSPVMVTKPVGPGSPQIFQSLVTNEKLTEVQIEFSRTVPGKGAIVPYYRILLSDATVVDCKQYVSDTEELHYDAFGGMKLVEDISFIFEKIEMDNLDGKTTFGDRWENPG